jgi:hypothetical protein
VNDPWQEGNRVLVRASDEAAVCTWRFELGAGADLRLVLDERSARGDRAGEVVIVAGTAMLTRGLDLAAGQELDVVDGPGLMLRLLVTLLARAIPGGPTAVTAPLAIDHAEPDQPLEISTLGATAAFPSPWQVRGEVRRTDEATIGFELVFTHGGAASIQLAGTWAQTTPAPALDEDMSLAGWQVLALGPRVGGEALDYGATAAPSPHATLGELRGAVAPRPAT